MKKTKVRASPPCDVRVRNSVTKALLISDDSKLTSTALPRYCCDINRPGLMASTRRDVEVQAREFAAKLGVHDEEFEKLKVLWRCVPVISSPSASSGSACLAQRRCVPRIEDSLWSCTLLCTCICTNGN